uniref:Coiled-coil domain-containing protein 132-like isoform x1 n=2 Tax=Tetraselmis sp. GSL018 TaxID=582737 RepID=A0A061RSJ3_9CHLO
MWNKALDALAQILLEGFSRVRRCTVEGRAAMTLDLQGFIKGTESLSPRDVDAHSKMRIVDNYIKAFYVPEQELVHWAHTHPEYTRTQLVNLVTCIADNNKMKRKALKDLLVQIESIA